MGNFFNMDNIVFTTLGKLCDILFLSVIWVVLCIPVITIGPATTAMYYTTVKVIRRERGYLMREFFKSFRLNFKRATIVGTVMTLMFLILAFDIYTSWAGSGQENSANSIFMGIYLALTVFLLSFSLYVFPVLSRFDMNVRQLVKASIFMSLKHLPFTILMLIVLIAAIAGIAFVPILIFALPSLATFVNSFLMERILIKYIPKSENPEEETSKDEWYLE
jgi:uncharacterized membrane protein YesL